MPQDKQDTPAMKAIKSVGPSIKKIKTTVHGDAMGPDEQIYVSRKKAPIKRKKGFFEEVGDSLSGLKYLPDYLLNNPRPRR